MFSSYIYFFLKPFTILQKVCQPQKTNVCRARAMASKYIIKQTTARQRPSKPGRVPPPRTQRLIFFIERGARASQRRRLSFI